MCKEIKKIHSCSWADSNWNDVLFESVTFNCTSWAATPWKYKDSTKRNSMVLVQRTEYLTGKSRNHFWVQTLSPFWQITSLCFSLFICWKWITILNCFAQCFENWSRREKHELDLDIFLFRAFHNFTFRVCTRLASCPVSMGEVFLSKQNSSNCRGGRT